MLSHLVKKAARGISSGRSVRSAPGRWQSRQLGLPLGGPQPSQLIHPRAGDSGQRDRLGPETTQDAGEICRRQPQPARTSPPMAGLARGWRAQPRRSGEGGRTRKSQSRFERQLRHSFTRILSGLLITFVPAIRPPCPPPFSPATLFKGKVGSTRWEGFSSTDGLCQTT